jgi:hypothetical protein
MTVYKRPDSPFYLIEFVYKGERHRFSSETTSKADAQAASTPLCICAV